MSVIAEPKGQARAAAAEEQRWQQTVGERNALQSAQATHSANIKIEKLARREPIIADLLEEYRALRATVENLRAQNADLETKHAELSREYQTQSAEKANLQIERDEQGRRAVELFDECERLQGVERQLGQDLEAARTELGKAKADLAAALKAPKGKA